MSLRPPALLALACVVAFASGCAREPATYDLKVPSSADLIPGGSVAIPVTLERNETADLPVSLRLGTLPEGIIATLDAPVLEPSQTVTTLHLQAEREVDRGFFMLDVMAEGDRGLSLTQTLIVTVSGLSIEGRLTSVYNDAPLGDATTLEIAGHRAITFDDGRFYEFDLAIPYDLTVRSEDLTEVFLGASTPTPHVIATWATPDYDPALASISGEVQPLPAAGEAVRVCPGSAPGVLSFECATVDPLTGRYDLTVGLLEPELQIRLVARRSTVDASDRVLAWTGTAETHVVVTAGSTASASLLQLAPSSHTELSVTPDMNGWTGTRMATTWVDFGDGISPVGRPIPEGASDVLVIPEGGFGIYEAYVDDDLSGHAMIAKRTDSDAPPRMPRPLTLLAPAAGAAIAPDTEFLVELPGGGLVSHVFELIDRTVVIHTMSDRLRLSELPILVDTAAILRWTVLHSPEVQTLDHALTTPAGYTRYEQLGIGISMPLAFEDVSYSASAPRPLNAGP